MKIHAQPGRPPTPCISSIAAASKPENAPDSYNHRFNKDSILRANRLTEAAEKNKAILEFERVNTFQSWDSDTR